MTISQSTLPAPSLTHPLNALAQHPLSHPSPLLVHPFQTSLFTHFYALPSPISTLSLTRAHILSTILGSPIATPLMHPLPHTRLHILSTHFYALRSPISTPLVHPFQQLGGDRFRVEHVISNLLSNAVKFSPEDSTIVITVSCGQPEVNKASQHTLSTHPLNTPYQPTHILADENDGLSHQTLNIPSQHILSTHPLFTPSQPTFIKQKSSQPIHILVQTRMMAYSTKLSRSSNKSYAGSSFFASGKNQISHEGQRELPVTFSITDEGPGISEENQSKLFNNFVQIRPSSLQKGQGSGLGLALCKAIVNLHGS